MTDSSSKRDRFWAIWLIVIGLFLVSGAIILDQLAEKVISATGGVIFVGFGLLTVRDRELHKWVREATAVIGGLVSLGIVLV